VKIMYIFHGGTLPDSNGSHQPWNARRPLVVLARNGLFLGIPHNSKSPTLCKRRISPHLRSNADHDDEQSIRGIGHRYPPPPDVHARQCGGGVVAAAPGRRFDRRPERKRRGVGGFEPCRRRPHRHLRASALRNASRCGTCCCGRRRRGECFVCLCLVVAMRAPRHWSSAFCVLAAQSCASHSE
jgi:hypothetical protein